MIESFQKDKAFNYFKCLLQGLFLFFFLILVYRANVFGPKSVYVFVKAVKEIGFLDVVRQIFSGIQYHWIFLMALISIAVVASKILIKAKKKPETKNNGLLSSKEFNQAYKEKINLEISEIYRDSKKKVSKRLLKRKLLGDNFYFTPKSEGLFLPRIAFEKGLSATGTPGSGKSTLIKHYIEYLNEKNEKALIPDINGEIYSELGRPEDIILSPFDSRSMRWDFDQEFSLGKKIPSHEYASFMVQEGSQRDGFFWKGGRLVLSEIFDLHPSSLELWGAICDEDNEFKENLSGLANKVVGNEGSNQGAGILGTMSTDLAFLKDLVDLNQTSKKDYFSIANWSQDSSTSNVYLIGSDTELNQMAVNFQIWINLAILGRFEAGKDNNLPKLNIMIDELASYRKIEKLAQATSRLRKYGGRVILGYQSEHQLDGIYGQAQANEIRSSIGTKFIFNIPGESDAARASKFLGQSEKISTSHTTSDNGSKGKYSSVSESSRISDIVPYSEIQSLADGHFFMRSANIGPVKSRILKKKWREINGKHSEFNMNADLFTIENTELSKLDFKAFYDHNF